MGRVGAKSMKNSSVPTACSSNDQQQLIFGPLGMVISNPLELLVGGRHSDSELHQISQAFAHAELFTGRHSVLWNPT